MNNKEFENLTQSQLNKKFSDACQCGDINLVKYLLTSPDLEKKADIHAKGYLSYATYRRNSPGTNDIGFLNALDNGHFEVLKYLIVKMNIKKTESIESYLEYSQYKEQVEKLFIMRDLRLNLRQELPDNKINKKKNKL